jgi:hypothetical protein
LRSEIQPVKFYGIPGACLNRGILDFFTGGKVLLQSAVDRHHILPRAQFHESHRTTADNIANVAFIAGDVNKAIGLSGPEVYLKRIGRKVLTSQCIPEDQSLWAIDRAGEFWAARRMLLADSFNDFCPRRAAAAPVWSGVTEHI